MLNPINCAVVMVVTSPAASATFVKWVSTTVTEVVRTITADTVKTQVSFTIGQAHRIVAATITTTVRVASVL